MQAIILTGGFGTRLQAVVKSVPKTMADINGKPFLSFVLDYLSRFEVRTLVLCTGYLQEKIIEYFGDSCRGMKISYSKEENPLGTGGAIVNALKYIDKNQPIIVLNGDSFLKIDYKKLMDFHLEKKSDLTIALRKMKDCARYGSVEINNENLITEFKEKDKKSACEGLINGGVYVINPKIFSDFDLTESFSFEKDFMMKYLRELQPYGFVVDNYFIDIGIPDDYKKAQVELENFIK